MIVQIIFFITLFYRILALDDTDQKKYDSGNQQDMDNPTKSVASDDTQNPEDEKYNRECDEHKLYI